MATIELIGVPFDGYGRPGHQAAASAVLREAGLAAAFAGHDVIDSGDLDLPDGEPARGHLTSLTNEAALVAMTDTLERRVAAALTADRFPVLYGADCTTLLGTMAGLGADGGPGSSPGGLLFVDGHEDAMPLDVSEDGEAANTEIGLLLGVTGRLMAGPLARRRGLLTTERLAIIGQRDADWRRRFNVGTLAELGVWSRTAAQVASRTASTVAAEAVSHLAQHSTRWWCHVDLDVVDPDQFPPQGLPDVPDEPGGLSWDQLTSIAVTAVAEPSCVGCSLAIYDPDQDPDRTGAHQIVQLARRIARSLP